MNQNSFYASAPTVVLPATHPLGQPFPTDSRFTPNVDNTVDDYFDATPSESIGTITPSAGALAGRKRNRNDDHSPADDDVEDHGLTNGAIDADPSLRMPTDHTRDVEMSIDDAAVSTMPFDAPHAESVAPRNERPGMTSRKSQRLDSSNGEDDHLAQLVLPPQLRELTKEPLIDEATRSLGISWTRMDSSEALLINQAAYSKWIEHHYSGLSDVVVWFENSALPGYLVCARNAYAGQQAFYIFSHDLTEARLVTSDHEQLIPRLKLLPALHLAAPGGVIQADGIMSKASTVRAGSNSTPDGVPGRSATSYIETPLVGMCAAHSMEMD